MQLTIATRKSKLALWQAEFVAEALKKAHPSLSINLQKLSTPGDEILDKQLNLVGGKGLFVKTLETALLDGTADLAVHSMKDMPAELPEGLIISTILPREDHRDVLISNRYAKLSDLPKGAIIGTASLRRQAQLLHHRPDLKIKLLRGNVPTRINKLDEDQYDAIVLAAAGVKRLQLADRISSYLDEPWCLSAVGQGAIGVEIRANDHKTAELLAPLHCQTSAECLAAERQITARLGSGCHVPIAALAQKSGKHLSLKARVAMPDGSRLIAAKASSADKSPQQLGDEVVSQLREQGAAEILAACPP